MTALKTKANKGNAIKEGMLIGTDIKALPLNSILDLTLKTAYNYRYTTGPFQLPENSGSLDWTLLNNDTTTQKARVTIYKCPVGTVKTQVPPGPLVVTLEPNRSCHNANTYEEGFAYEVVVECNSQLIFPYVSVWPGNFGVIIPGTGINSGTFIRQMP